MIDFVLEDNFPTKDKPNDRRARAVNQHTYTEVDLAAAIADRNISISKPESLLRQVEPVKINGARHSLAPTEPQQFSILNAQFSIPQMSVGFVHDVKSNTTNEKITRGGTVKITGHNLKIAGLSSSIGIVFISREDPEAVYRVPIVDIIVNNPSELMVVAPQMTVGEPVVLKITTQYASGGKNLKDPRSFTFEKELTVV